MNREPLLELYESVGWVAYTKAPATLRRAIENSTYVVTVCEGERVVALARCVSDDASVMYLQDILVAPSHQRQGLGRLLIEDCLARFAHCRQKVLLTDNSPEQIGFYQRVGFKLTTDLSLNAFVQVE